MHSKVFALSALAVAFAPASAQQVYSPGMPGGVETITVTASPISKGLDDTATIVAKVDREDILTGGGNLAEALAAVPGVTGSGFAAGASRPIIRGMDSNRVKLVENGLSSSDVSDVGPDHGIPIDPLSTQSIEVVRGAATLRYGSQAIGGVVNAINNRVPSMLPDEAFSGAVSATYGSVSNNGETSVLLDGASGNFAFHADGFYRNAGDYETPLGRQDNSFFTGNGGALGASYFFGGQSHTGLAVVQYDAKYGIPSGDSFILMRQTKLLSRSSFAWGGDLMGPLNLDMSYANYSHEEKEPDGTVGATFKNKEFDGRAEQLVGAVGPFSSTAVGMEVQNREYSALGEGGDYLYPTVTTSVAGYLFTEVPLADNLRLEGSARIENVNISGTPASDIATERDFTPVSGAVGLLWDASDWLKLGFTASTAGRAPAQTELFARGGHDGPGTYEMGDPTLKAERANSLEWSARLRFEKLSFDVALWSSWFDNYIYGELTGSTCDDDGLCLPGDAEELKELNYVQDSAHFRGLEAQGRYEMMDTGNGVLSLIFQGDYVRASLAGGANVPRIPPYRVGGGLAWNGATIDASVQVLYSGRQDKFGLYDTPTPAFTEVNASIAWRPLEAHPGFEVLLSGHNLADTEQRNAASFNKDVILMPGRDIRVVLRQAF